MNPRELRRGGFPSLLRRIAELGELDHEQQPGLPVEWRKFPGVTEDVMNFTAVELTELRQRIFRLATHRRWLENGGSVR
jgi:hypothetical protein